MEKITKRMKNDAIVAILKGEVSVENSAIPVADLIAHIVHENELLAKKNTSSGKPTKTQVENAGFKEVIVTVLTSAEKPLTISEIQSADTALSTLSNQKMTHLLSQMRADGAVERTEIKGKAYFAVVTVADSDEE